MAQVHVCNDFGLSEIAAHFGKTEALDTYYEGAEKESMGDVDGAILLYRRAFRMWPALDSVASAGLPSGVRAEAEAANFRCAGMIGLVPVPLARASNVVCSAALISDEEIREIEQAQLDIAALQTPLENNPQNATHVCKTNTMLNDPPSYTFAQRAPHIVAKLKDFAKKAWEQENWSAVGGPLEAIVDGVPSLSIRMIEHWEYKVGSGLLDSLHYDTNSVLTLVIMLSQKNAFEGGEFQTNESNDHIKVHSLDRGDAICFVSHKYHNISQITNGVRKTLVMELWQGGTGHLGRGD